ncbi:hypothetical protein D5b_00386 [Faustovirus]|nr:hypothetical protein D5b_00386 [Faustovirus]
MEIITKHTILLIDDVLNLIIKLTPTTFLYVDKNLHNKVINGIINGVYDAPYVDFKGICAAIKSTPTALFARLITRYTGNVNTARQITTCALSNGFYEKAELIASRLRIHERIIPHLCVASCNVVEKYYELYGVNDIKITETTIIGGKWAIIIKPEDFIPLIPRDLLADLFKVYGGAIWNNPHIHNRRVFKHLPPEHLFDIMVYYDIVHHKLLIQMARDGRIDLVEQLFIMGKTPSYNERLAHYIETYIYDKSPYDNTIMQQLRNYMKFDDAEVNDITFNDYRSACHALDAYIESAIRGQAYMQIGNFINAFNKLYDAILIERYEIDKDIIALFRWGLKMQDSMLIHALVGQNLSLTMYVGRKSDNLQYLFDALAILQIDIILPKHHKIYKAVVLIAAYVGTGRYVENDVKALIGRYEDKLHPNTLCIIYDAMDFANHVLDFRGRKFDDFTTLHEANLRANKVDDIARKFIFKVIKKGLDHFKCLQYLLNHM